MAPIPTEAVQPTQPVPDTPPEAVLRFRPTEAGVGEEIMFDGSQSAPGSSPIASYVWDFGDGSKASGGVVTHPYANPGTYRATLTVTGEDGLSSKADAEVVIHDEAPPAPTEGPLPTATTAPTEAPQPTDAPPPTDTPIPEPTIPPPDISSFEVSPEEVTVGGCFNISWSAGGGTNWVNIVRNDDFIWENAPLDGALQDCPDTAGEYLYKIVAYNEVDDRTREQVTVTVNEE
jgi:PKD repeat protein